MSDELDDSNFIDPDDAHDFEVWRAKHNKKVEAMRNQTQGVIMPDDTMTKTIKQFKEHYISCMLWSTTGDDGRPLEDYYDESDFSEQLKRQIEKDCKAFVETNFDMISMNIERAGHDFWLTREGHGAGYWDGGWPDDVGKKLTECSEAYGPGEVYVGDNNKLYCM